MLLSGFCSVTATKWLLNYYMSKLGSVSSSDPFIMKYKLMMICVSEKSIPELMQSLSEAKLVS